jgi:hypothetical protein
MDAETLKALKKSIKHWEGNAKADHVELAFVTSYHCALCDKFLVECDDLCIGCPVADKTEQPCCEGSPWEAAYNARCYWYIKPNDIARRDAFRAAAQAEVDFLKSLLPKEGEAQ